MPTNVVGLFDHPDAAEAAAQDLVAAGFAREQISVVAQNPHGNEIGQHVEADGAFIGEGAVTGITSGALIGGLLGVLIGAGLLLVPVGVVAAGPILGLIAGSAAGAATGGVIGAFAGFGVPSEEAAIYAEGVRRGGTVLAVQTSDDRVAKAHEILDRDGAVNIQDRGVLYRSEGFSDYDPKAPIYTAEQQAAERARYAMTPTAAERVRRYTTGDESRLDPNAPGFRLPTDLPADEPVDAGDDSRVGDVVPVEDTMGGYRPRYGSLDDAVGIDSLHKDADGHVNIPDTSNGPGVQTGGHADDGTPDTRGIMEKIADTFTGNPVDDKTGKRVD